MQAHPAFIAALEYETWFGSHVLSPKNVQQMEWDLILEKHGLTTEDDVEKAREYLRALVHGVRF